jgi:hypothetical protein
MKSRKLIWVGHVAPKGNTENGNRDFVRKVTIRKTSASFLGYMGYTISPLFQT